MQIQDVERETGLDRATIRFYEKERIVVPKRMDNGYRTYSDDDIALLLKIKLLRLLGVSLFNIKCLQNGTGNFGEILSEQVKALENQIRLNEQAKFVCAEIQRDCAEYENLDTVYYLRLLESPLVSASHSFQEPVKKQAHPWRRYFARMLDYSLLGALLEFILVVVLRIRPFNDGAEALVGFATYFIAIPVFAALLHFWGTTPGKWVMGIKIENINGGKLSYYDAFVREKDIIWHGLGFFFPILSWWRLYASYKEDSAGEENYWNHTSEIIYVDWSNLKKWCLAGLYCASLAIALITSMQVNMPKYIGNKLTVKRFAECHLDYENMLQARTELVLNEDGRWEKDIEPYVLYSTLDSLAETVRPDFQYKLVDGYVRGVHYNNTWVTEYMFSAIPEYYIAAMYTIVGSRPNTTYFDLVKMEDALQSTFNQQLFDAISEGETSGSITVKDVEISWTITLANCEWVHEDQLFAADGQKFCYTLDINTEIIE